MARQGIREFLISSPDTKAALRKAMHHACHQSRMIGVQRAGFGIGIGAVRNALGETIIQAIHYRDPTMPKGGVFEFTTKGGHVVTQAIRNVMANRHPLHSESNHA